MFSSQGLAKLFSEKPPGIPSSETCDSKKPKDQKSNEKSPDKEETIWRTKPQVHIMSYLFIYLFIDLLKCMIVMKIIKEK